MEPSWGKQIKFIGSDIQPIGIHADVGIIAQTLRRYVSVYAIDFYSGYAAVVRRAIRAVILHRQMKDGPATKRVGSIAYSNIQMVLAIQVLGRYNRAIKCKHHMKPALRCGIKMACGIGNRRPKLQRVLCPINRRRITVKRIQVGDTEQRAAIWAVDVENVIHRFQHKAIARAERLVRRLNRKLVAIVGKALVEKVEAIKAGNDLRV